MAQDGGVNRRQLLAGGALATAGWMLPGAGRAETTPARSRREVSCIMVWLGGGPAAIDLWDPKPLAPSEIRGPFQCIATNVPGVQISEHLPRCATIAEKYCLVRSLTHAREDHEGASHVNSTGWDTWPAQSRTSIGETLGYLQHAPGALPFHLRLPVVPPQPRFDRELLRSAHAPGTTGPLPGSEGAGETARGDQLESLLVSARRMVETGVRFVTVVDDGWDTHTEHFRRLERDLLPNLDRALYRLLTDLDDRGMLASTLVVVTGEFSRSPRINRDGGRDHWSHVQSVLLAGGGIPGGTVIGASDESGAFPETDPIAAHDLAATIYHKFGVDPGMEFRSPEGLRLLVLPEGAQPIRGLI